MASRAQLHERVTELEKEVAMLRDRFSRRPSEALRKEELVEIAVTELSYPRERAMKMLVAELRECIRAAREPFGPVDPLSVKPPGLSRMSKPELQAECGQRGLPYMEYPDGKERVMTRGAMIVLIQDDVEARQAALNATQSEEVQTPSPEPATEPDWYQMDAEDEEMPQSATSTKRTGSSLPSVPRFPKAKPKGNGRGRQ